MVIIINTFYKKLLNYQWYHLTIYSLVCPLQKHFFTPITTLLVLVVSPRCGVKKSENFTAEVFCHLKKIRTTALDIQADNMENEDSSAEIIMGFV